MEQVIEIKLPVEVWYKKELDTLAARDTGRNPLNWKLSLMALRTFILGSGTPFHYNGEEITIRRKYLGNKCRFSPFLVRFIHNFSRFERVC